MYYLSCAMSCPDINRLTEIYFAGSHTQQVVLLFTWLKLIEKTHQKNLYHAVISMKFHQILIMYKLIEIVF